MAYQLQNLQLPDGRNLDYSVAGPEDAKISLIWIHGTPGAAIPVPTVVTACAKKGIKVIAFSRPGYGGSTRRKGRRVIDAVDDIQYLKEHLGVKQCLVGGWSGGGPHTLACAARLPGCLAAVTFAGGAPYHAEGLDYLAGQGEDNVQEFSAAIQGEAQLRAFCEPQREALIQSDLEAVMAALDSLLPPVDNECMKQNRDTIGQNMVDVMCEAFRLGCDGWIDDDLENIGADSWGFELSEVKVPVLILQGDLDKMVPYAHGKWLADHLPQDKVRRHLMQGHGHISILANVDDIIDELLTEAKL
ncbi:hypothetical protein UA08_06783 [Talaromyces atroroseus]|uniref:AB hydrolase-1 domain-containing protein n=1 Tax=Talaromyces atroroseus TaxID=1441469 RepID=A0A225AC49_TALAT|nr:hypothetical protein UA08_06783 [Talaromyces atroroseus]OKL57930.1 hypothetical protein UA08_06783 [Talaromyces atroroseus]